jgi:hypothetical protein
MTVCQKRACLAYVACDTKDRNVYCDVTLAPANFRHSHTLCYSLTPVGKDASTVEVVVLLKSYALSLRPHDPTFLFLRAVTTPLMDQATDIEALPTGSHVHVHGISPYHFLLDCMCSMFKDIPGRDRAPSMDARPPENQNILAQSGSRSDETLRLPGAQREIGLSFVNPPNS